MHLLHAFVGITHGGAKELVSAGKQPFIGSPASYPIDDSHSRERGPDNYLMRVPGALFAQLDRDGK